MSKTPFAVLRSPGARAGRRFLMLCALGILASATAAAESAPREYDLKATLLFNFCHFVEWPPRAFADAQAPLLIGILGADPFGSSLDELVKNERAHNRAIEVRRFTRVEEAAAAHVLFISGSERTRLDAILAGLRGRPTLTVGEGDRAFVRRGGMIGFVTDRSNIRLRINLPAARTADLTISAKLLKVADVVGAER